MTDFSIVMLVIGLIGIAYSLGWLQAYQSTKIAISGWKDAVGKLSKAVDFLKELQDKSK